MTSGYEQIWNKIYNKANKLAYQESMQATIPNIHIGDAHYTRTKCMAFVICKLKEKKTFTVKRVKPNLLIITNILKDKVVKGKEITDIEILRIMDKFVKR